MRRYAWSIELRDRVIDTIALRGALRRPSEMAPSRWRIVLLETLQAAHFALASCIVFAIALLSDHGDGLALLRREIASQSASGSHPSARGGVPDSVMAVVYETIRLYPPAWLLAREAVTNDTVPGGHYIPAGARVLISPYVMHRDSRWWPEPGRFDPSRFTNSNTNRVRFSYLPFGWGATICPAASQAPRYAGLLLTLLLPHVELASRVNGEIQASGLVTLRAEGVGRLASCPQTTSVGVATDG